jgi:hypothetical protein
MSTRGKEKLPIGNSFEALYPHVTFWVKHGGWIEMGDDECSPSFVRALDGGGMVWEGAGYYQSVDAALKALEIGLQGVMQEQGIGPYSQRKK